MKNAIRIFSITVAAIGFASASYAQEQATATVSATIVTPISIVKDIDMNFGNVAVQSTLGGTVVLAPASTRTVTAGVTLPNVTGTVTAASFTVAGTSGYTYVITLPTTPVTLDDGAANNMTVTDFTSNPSGTGSLTAGTETLTVGATLNVGAAQVAGVYESATPFPVIVNYN